MRFKLVFIAAITASIAWSSCQKEINLEQDATTEAVFPQTPKEKQTVVILKEVSDILKEVYKDRKAFYEVNAAIYSGYYEDESVLLKDLLFPDLSNLYKSEKFKHFKVEPGIFRKRFSETLVAGDYFNLKKAMGIDPSYNNTSTRTQLSIPTDTTMQIYSNSNGVAIYFPYSENFAVPLTTSYFDNINTDPYGYMATIVSADREADSGPGSEPHRVKRNVNNDVVFVIEYTTVTVNDIYAEGKVTHIVGVGAEPARMLPADPPPSTNVNRVFHGWSRITEQLDHFISLSGNGGGSEMKIARISGYLQFQDQQVTNFAGDVISAYYTRKEIRKKRWKRVYGVWDADWVPNNLEQTYATWEDDTKGTKTFTGSLSTTLTASAGNTITGTIGFNISVQTQDELVRQLKLTRAAYFGAAKSDQGCLFQMCDDLECRYDNTFLTTGYWPIYDCGAIWSFTWPYNSY